MELNNNKPVSATNGQVRNISNVKKMRKAFGRGVKKLVRAARYLMMRNNSNNGNKNRKISVPPTSRDAITSTIDNKVIETNDMGGQELKTTAFDNQSIHASASQKNQPHNLNRVDNKPLLNISDKEHKQLKQAMWLSGLSDQLPIHSISNMDGVIAQKGKNMLFLVDIKEASKDGLSNTGNLCTKNKGGLTNVYQVISSTADKALICASELNDMLDESVNVPLPCNKDIDYSNLEVVGNGRNSTVYSLNNEKVVSEVSDKSMEGDPDYKEKLKSVLSLMQFDNYVKCDSFSVSENQKTAYITMEKLEKLDFNTLETSEVRPIIKKFFEGLKEMKEKKVFHGDAILKNIKMRKNGGDIELALIDPGVNTAKGINSKEDNNEMRDISAAAEFLRHELDAKNYTKEFVKSISSLRENFYKQLRKDGVDINKLEPELFKIIGSFLAGTTDGIFKDKIKNNLIDEFTKFFSNENKVFNEDVISNSHLVRNSGNNAAFIQHVNKQMESYSEMKADEFLKIIKGCDGKKFALSEVSQWRKKAKKSDQYLVGLKLLTTVLIKADSSQFGNLPKFENSDVGVSKIGSLLKRISEKEDCDAEFDRLVNSL